MEFTGRRKSIAGFIALGVGLISILLVLYIGYFLLNWRHGVLLVLGILLVLMISCGILLNTIFLVREIRRNEQHDAFINAVTHELKTPVASIRLYLETLQTRPVDEAKRQEFYTCWTIATACSPPSSRSCARAASARRASPQPHAHRPRRGRTLQRGTRADPAPRAGRWTAIPAVWSQRPYSAISTRSAPRSPT